MKSIKVYFNQLYCSLKDLYYYWNTARYTKITGNENEYSFFKHLMDREIESIKSHLKYPFTKNKKDPDELPF